MSDARKYATTKEAAAEYGFAEITFKVWRQRNEGPPYVRFGDSPNSRVMYPRDELEKWVQEHTVYPGADCER